MKSSLNLDSICQSEATITQDLTDFYLKIQMALNSIFNRSILPIVDNYSMDDRYPRIQSPFHNATETCELFAQTPDG